MKKLLSFILALTMLCAMLVLPSFAADNVNYEQTFEFVKTAPKVDGVVKSGEYGDILPIHKYSESKSQFVTNEGHTKLTGWDFSFFSAWDYNTLYMAWVVESDVHAPLPKAEFDWDGTPIGDNFTSESLGYMWMYSSVQFIITPGAPLKGYTSYDDNYLEVGFCELEDHTTGRATWKYPAGVSADQIALDKWQAVVKRDDAKGTTTYEVAIPWRMIGIESADTNQQFGLTYAVAAQEHYNKTPGMIEWQNGILGGKFPDNAAVITLRGGIMIGPVDPVDPVDPEKTNGTIPEYFANKTHLIIDKVDEGIAGEDAALITDIWNLDLYNLNWTYNLLLKPIYYGSTLYEVVEVCQSAGEAPRFSTSLTSDMIVAAFHSDGMGSGAARKYLAQNITVGTTVGFWEIDLYNGETKYKNSSMYIEALGPDIPVISDPDTSKPEVPDVSRPEDQETSGVIGDSSYSESESVKGEAEKKPNSSFGSSITDKAESISEKSRIPLWIVIFVIVLLLLLLFAVIPLAVLIVIIIIIVKLVKKSKAKKAAAGAAAAAEEQTEEQKPE